MTHAGLYLDIASRATGRLGWSAPQAVGSGTEFVVYSTHDEHGQAWALRVPRKRIYQTANNPGVRASDLQNQEHRLTAWAAEHGLPVSRPERLFDVDGYPVLVTELCPDDGSAVDCHRLGEVLARLHATPPPDLSPVAQRGEALPTLLARRLTQRYAALGDYTEALPALPAEDWLRSVIHNGQPPPRVLHLDIRRPNVLTVAGRPRALVDWANVLLADPMLELARVVEYGVLPENAIDAPGVLAGYAAHGGRTDTGGARWSIYRLDAAVMLAVVFASVAPDAARLRLFLDRVRDLVGQL